MNRLMMLLGSSLILILSLSCATRHHNAPTILSERSDGSGNTEESMWFEWSEEQISSRKATLPIWICREPAELIRTVESCTSVELVSKEPEDEMPSQGSGKRKPIKLKIKNTDGSTEALGSFLSFFIKPFVPTSERDQAVPMRHLRLTTAVYYSCLVRGANDSLVRCAEQMEVDPQQLDPSGSAAALLDRGLFSEAWGTDTKQHAGFEPFRSLHKSLFAKKGENCTDPEQWLKAQVCQAGADWWKRAFGFKLDPQTRDGLYNEFAGCMELIGPSGLQGCLRNENFTVAEPFAPLYSTLEDLVQSLAATKDNFDTF